MPASLAACRPAKHHLRDPRYERLLKTPRGTAIQVVVSSRFTQNSEGLAYRLRRRPARGRRAHLGIPLSTCRRSPRTLTTCRRVYRSDLMAAPSAPYPRHRQAQRSQACTVAPLAFFSKPAAPPAIAAAMSGPMPNTSIP